MRNRGQKIRETKRYFTALGILLAVLVLWHGSAAAAETNLDEARGLIRILSNAAESLPEDTSQPVTRRQFVSAAAALFRGGETACAPVGFSDVAADDPLFAVLGQAVAVGMIADGETFRPEDPITRDECIKICCTAAGYDVKAELLGGYPTGYRTAANRSGVSDGIGGAGTEISGEEAWIFLWNTLNTEVLEPTAYGGETTQYGAREGETLLAQLYDIYTAEGILNANEYAALGQRDMTGSAGWAEIDGVRFALEYQEANRYLGYRVRGYYRLEEQKQTLVYAVPLDNERLELRAEDVAYDPENRTITYGDKKRKAVLEAGFERIYNGKPDYGFGEDPIPASGRLTLVDNNRDGRYDVLDVEEVYYLKIGAINKYYSTVSDADDAEKTLELNAPDCRYWIYGSEGETLALTELQTGDILAVEASEDRLLITMTLCGNSVSGVLERIQEERVTVGGEPYELDPVFERFYQDKLSVGGSYVFVLGLDGRIVDCQNGDAVYVYGYLYNAALEGAGFSPRVSLKIFSDTAKHLILTCADKVLLNGSRAKPEEVYQALCPEGRAAPQLVRYLVNQEGELARLDTAAVRDELDLSTLNDPDDSLTAYAFPGAVNFRQQVFYPYFNASAATVFKIPRDLTDEKAFAIGHSFMDGNYNTVTAYDIDRAGRAKAIVYISDDSALTMTSNSDIMLLEEIFSSLDEDGILRTKVTGWQNGSFSEYFLDDDVEVLKHGAPAQLAGGDIIRFSESGGSITKLVVDFDGAAMTPNTGADTAPFNGNSSILQYQAGAVYSMESGYMYLSKTAPGQPVSGAFANLCNVRIPSQLAVYDCHSGTVRTADSSYIKTVLSDGGNASYMVVKQHYMSSQYGFIYVLDDPE